MSSRFPPTSNSDSRYSRERSPNRALDRRGSAQYSDGALTSRTNEPNYRPNDSYGYQGRGREPPREPPRGPKALVDGPRGGYIPRGRGFPGRGEPRDREYIRDEPFARRGRGQDWTLRDRFDARDRRPSPAGRDRSRSPLSRDFRDPRDPREFAPRDESRTDFRDGSIGLTSETFPYRGRGGIRGRGRVDWRGRHPEDRDVTRPRSRSRDREWDQQMRDDRDHDRDFDGRRDDELRREREERDDRFRREQPPYRPASRNSTGGPSTPIPSRSTSTASIHTANIDRYNQNTRDSRDILEQRPWPQSSNPDIRIGSVDREPERGDPYSKRTENDRFASRTASPPPQAPPVPAFGSIPQRTPANAQGPPTKEEPRQETSPLIHPSRLKLLDASRDVPSAPKAHILNNAPTGPKAQQASDRWPSNEVSEPIRRVADIDGDRLGSQRQAIVPPQTVVGKESFEQARGMSRRFPPSNTSPVRPIISSISAASDSTQPSVKKAVEEQGRNGNTPTTGGSTSNLKPPSGEFSNQGSPIKIPTGPRAERAPPPIRQPAPLTMRGGPGRGQPMGRGRGAWTWSNPARPPPRGPSIMNTVPTKRDSISEDRARTGPPSMDSAESAIRKWRNANEVAGTTTSSRDESDKTRDLSSSKSSPEGRHSESAGDAIKIEDSGVGEPKSRMMALDQENEEEDSDEASAEEGDMGLDEGDFAEAEKKFDQSLQALQAKRPPTPRSNPVLLELLEELDALASALEDKSKIEGSDEQPAMQSLSLEIRGGLPSPDPEGNNDMDLKRESYSPPLSIKARPQTPSIESLPFLASGPPTPFSQIDDLQEEFPRKDAIEDLLIQKLMRQREILQAENDEAREFFQKRYKAWRGSVEAFEEEKRVEDPMAFTDTPDEAPLTAPTPPVVGRRAKVISELDMQEVIRASQETAAREERARREREQPVYIRPETFNSDREAEVPNMLGQEERKASIFFDKNTLVDREFALEALEFIPKKDDFTPEENEDFIEYYCYYPKRFGIIAEHLKNRDYRDCVQHYYATKLSVKYKDREAAFLKTKKGRKLQAASMRQLKPRSTGLISSFDGMADYANQTVALTEKGRPRRAAAPTFGDAVESDPTPAVTPARRGAAGKENLNGSMSVEKPAGKRTRTVPAKEKGARKAKAPLLAAAPGPSPQKGLEDAPRLSKEPQSENEQRLEDIEGAQALAGLNSGQVYAMPMYKAGSVEGWTPEQQATINNDTSYKYTQQLIQDQPNPPPTKTGGQPATSSYWSVPEQTDMCNYLAHFGTNWQAIAQTMKTKTHTMVRMSPLYKQIVLC